jgi:hypothetical protein
VRGGFSFPNRPQIARQRRNFRRRASLARFPISGSRSVQGMGLGVDPATPRSETLTHFGDNCHQNGAHTAGAPRTDVRQMRTAASVEMYKDQRLKSLDEQGMNIVCPKRLQPKTLQRFPQTKKNIANIAVANRLIAHEFVPSLAPPRADRSGSQLLIPRKEMHALAKAVTNGETGQSSSEYGLSSIPTGLPDPQLHQHLSQTTSQCLARDSDGRQWPRFHPFGSSLRSPST